jgi:hypothetical protein
MKINNQKVSAKYSHCHHMTWHAEKRVRQRGFKTRDINFIMKHGELVNDGYVLTVKAVEKRRSELKKELQRLDKLTNVAVIASEGTVITIYRADSRNVRRLRSGGN